MQEYLTTVSRYLLVLCMSFYALDCFWIFRYKNEQEGGFLYLRQNFWMFAIQLISFFNLAILSRDKRYVVLYIALQIFLFLVLLVTSLIYRKCNRLLLNNMCMLMGIGMIMISRLSIEKSIRQFKIMVLAYVLCMLVPVLVVKLKFIPKLTWLYALLGIMPLGLVLALGETTLGSKLSFTIQGITFQPSELVKILFVFFLAGALGRSISFPNVLLTTLVAGIHVLILVGSTDLGSGLIFFVVYLAVLFVASRNYGYLLLGVAGGAGASVLAYQLFSHVRIRVLAFINPWNYIDNQGYQITQSLFAIGSGSWFGMGLYQGTPEDIPYVEEDFIFSAVCEEFGTLFGIILLLIILSCFIMMIKIALKHKQNFYRLSAFGFGIVYIFQTFLTVGGGIKFIPLTGVTLPFISYGGSSVVTTMLMFFLLQGIYMLGIKENNKPPVVMEEEVTDVEEENEIRWER
ncbi:MAG: FtsW/RodA/SpoVE family cell cycle protein [Lachnospiraceae bacterium]|nr:FtsW/RodA/SpoVE family cell cycle protein [Lachnospiraceae bacterium]